MNKKDLEILISEGKAKEVIGILLKLKQVDEDLQKSIILLSSQFEELNNQDIINVIDRGRQRLELSKIEYSLLSVINKIFALTPDKVNVLCYIVVTTKEKVWGNIGETCSCHLEEDRYHDSDIGSWKPFYQKDTIINILSELKRHYPFQDIYLEKDDNDEHSEIIDREYQNCIGVIDLLSVSNENRDLVRCFDNVRVAGVITPRCRNITKHDSLYEHLEMVQADVFGKLNRKLSSGITCSNYLFDNSDYKNFVLRLKSIFEHKFPIRNQSTVKSDVRNIKI